MKKVFRSPINIIFILIEVFIPMISFYGVFELFKRYYDNFIPKDYRDSLFIGILSIFIIFLITLIILLFVLAKINQKITNENFNYSFGYLFLFLGLIVLYALMQLFVAIENIIDLNSIQKNASLLLILVTSFVGLLIPVFGFNIGLRIKGK